MENLSQQEEWNVDSLAKTVDRKFENKSPSNDVANMLLLMMET